MTTTGLSVLDISELGCNILTQEIPVDPEDVSFVGCGPKFLSVVTKDSRVYTSGLNHSKLTEWKQPQMLKKYEVSQVKSGLSHFVGLTTDHRLLTWGKNNLGQLGRRTQTSKGRKQTQFFNAGPVSSLSNIKVMKVCCGDNHVMCLSEEGHVYTWGANDAGQLGCTSRATTEIPQIVKFLENIQIVQIAAGGRCSVAVSASGQVFCWGLKRFGPNGVQNEDDKSSIVAKDPALWCPRIIETVCCGENHIAILTQDGCVYTLGLECPGHLGQDDRGEMEFQPRQIESLRNVSQIACGRNHLLAWIEETHQLHVFGSGEPQIIDLLPDQQETSTLLCGGMFAFVHHSISDVIPTHDSHPLTLDSLLDDLNQSKEKHDDNRVRNRLERALSHAACINGSFLLNENGNHICSESDHGVDFKKAEWFFEELRKSPYHDIAKKALIKLKPKGSGNLFLGFEMLRLHLILPCCLYADLTTYDDEVVSSLANHILCLDDCQQTILGNWSKVIPTKFFKRLVWFFKMRVSRAFDRPQDAQKESKIVKNCIKVLDLFYRVNKSRSVPIQHDKFYVKDFMEKIDIEKDFRSFTQDKRHDDAKIRFCEYPFLYNAGAKCLLLKCQCEKMMEESDSWSPQLTVFREDLISGTREFLDMFGTEVLSGKLEVLFEGKTPSESGDGIRQEYFRLLFEQLVEPNFGVFYNEEESGLLWFNQNFKPDKVYLVGVMCGLALYNGFMVHLKFPAALYKKLLNQCLTFEDLCELKPHIDRQEDVNQLINNHLNTSIEEQFEKFKEGFYAGIPKHLLSSIHPKELEEILIGNDRYDFTALENVTKYSWPYDKNHKTIQYFWKVLHELELEDQKAFLRCVTGTDRIPAHGMEKMKFAIVPRLNDVQLNHPDDLLPYVWTCLNCIQLPPYTNEEILRMQLLCVIRSACTFSLP